MAGAPLHSLVVGPDVTQKWLAVDAGARPALVRGLTDTAVGSGRAQATLFLSRLEEVLSTEVPTLINGVQYVPIALDVTADPLPMASAADKAQFGPIYAAAACAFLAQLQATPKTSGDKVILFADPTVYAAYNLGRNGCGLERLPVWIAYHSRDGDRYDGPSAAPDAGSIGALCRPAGAADRCLMQQYSSAATFAVFQPGSHLHLDRFYGRQADFDALMQSYK